MKALLLILLGLVIGVGVGNHNGDQATLRDCATAGKAKLKGGGSISCTVIKDS